MSVALWRIGTDTPSYESDDLSGKGAETTGGRWNRAGRPVVYAASSISLACLETVVHLSDDSLPTNRFLVRIDVPDDVWAERARLTADELPLGWTAVPHGRVSLDAGDAWLKRASTALLEVPSTIVPEETNVLINPMHSQASTLQATKIRPWFYDGRLG